MTATTADHPGAAAPLGRVYLTGMPGTPVGRFDFIVDVDSGRDVEIGTAVAAETAEGVMVGTVIDMRSVGRGLDPMHEASSMSWHPDRVGHLPEAVVATVQVYSSPKMRPVRDGVVRPATAEEVLEATGYAQMEWPVAVGAMPLLTADDGQPAQVRVCVDGTFLVGPEGQGVIVAGKSGVASKTSFLSVMLRGMLADRSGRSVAALVFNVKGDDLIYLDAPTQDERFGDDDRALYEAMGIPAEPFDDVTVYAPARSIDGAANSNRPDAVALKWDLRTAWDGLRYFWPDLYSDEKLSAFVAMFREQKLNHPNPHQRISTFDGLVRFLEEQIADAEGANPQRTTIEWNGIHVATAQRVLRKFRGLQAKGRGLFIGGASPSGDAGDVPVEGWQHGQVVVVDIAGLEPDVQAFVIARTVDRVMRSADGSAQTAGLGVDHLAIVADELNQWAPSHGSDHGQIKSVLKRVATQGRFAGLGLIGAAQAASRVDPLLVENCASRAVGTSAETELTSGVHGRLPSGMVERLATLPKGQMAIWHTAFRQAVVVKFPRPAWQLGKPAGVLARRKSQTTSEILAEHLGDKRVGRLTEGIDPAVAAEIVAGSESPDDAAARLAKHREPDMTKVAVHARRVPDATNPYEL